MVSPVLRDIATVSDMSHALKDIDELTVYNVLDQLRRSGYSDAEINRFADQAIAAETIRRQFVRGRK